MLSEWQPDKLQLVGGRGGEYDVTLQGRKHNLLPVMNKLMTWSRVPVKLIVHSTNQEIPCLLQNLKLHYCDK
jgi:hypothetical protein